MPTDNLDVDMLPARTMLPVLKNDEGANISPYELLRMDPSNLATEFRIQAAWQAALSWGASRAALRCERLERDVEVLESKLYFEHRDRLSAGSSRPPGVETVKAAVAIDPRLEALYRDLFDAREKKEAWKSISTALAAKRDMLTQLGAEMRLDRRSTT